MAKITIEELYRGEKYDIMSVVTAKALQLGTDERTEDGNTLKRRFWENGRPKLHAENKTYKGTKLDFYPRELTIQGIALKVIKDIR